MTTTYSIIGIPVTEAEYYRFCQIRGEMVNSGKSDAEAEHWAACAVGISSQFAAAKADRDERASS